MDNHLLSHAIAIATEAHKGQKDKYGQEYLHHPIRVMNMGRNLKEKIVGILHDVVEDTEWTFEDLEKEGFSADIIEAVRCVTNMDVRCMPCIGEKEVTRLRKYLKAYHRLMPLYMNH